MRISDWSSDVCSSDLRDFFDYLPENNRSGVPVRPTSDPYDRAEESLDTLIPPNANQPYDMHELIRKTVDEGDFFEVQPAHAGNIICGCGRIEGRPKGRKSDGEGRSGCVRVGLGGSRSY